MIGAVLDHLWQSTLFAGATGVFTLMLKENKASARFWLWFAASVKFLVPFAVLTALSGALLAPSIPPLPGLAQSIIQPAAEPFGASVPLLAAPVAKYFDPAPLLLLVWGLGFVAVAAHRIVLLLRLRRLCDAAIDLPIPAPVRIAHAPGSLEPGLAGIWRPAILLPEGIETRLSPEELKTIIAHELCHWSRRDNLMATIQMLVEAIFWFYPLVWWIGIRLDVERERACDEVVLADGGSPEIYAESILKVCRFYLRSPLYCGAGVAGGDLKKRLREIMETRLKKNLGGMKTFALATAAAIAVGVPVAAGMIPPPLPFTATSGTPNPGSEESVRRVIQEWENHNPDTTTRSQTPGMAEAAKQQRAHVQKEFDDWGALRSITFQGKSLDWDVYLVAFAHELTQWQIAPLTADGKIRGLVWARADTTKPSPGTEAALRRQIDGWERHQPALDDMTPSLAATSRAQQASTQKMIDGWGALKSLRFHTVNVANWDVYDAIFDHGRGVFLILPLTPDGKIDSLAFTPAFDHPEQGPSPGTQAALKAHIEALERGAPAYDDMTPEMGAAIRTQLPAILAQVKRWGDVKGMQFRAVAPNGMDRYDVTFEHSDVEWHIAPLTAQGKIQGLTHGSGS